MSNRKEATAHAVKLLSMIDGYNDSVKEVESMLNALTDAEFKKYMEELRDGTEYIPYYMPTFGNVDISPYKNIEIGEKLGIKFFHRLWLTDPSTGDVYLTPDEYLVMDVPFRRQQQHLKKKISIPDSNKSIDELTGQVTGSSKGSALSAPEVQIAYSQGMVNTIKELYKFRGGDTKANAALVRNMIALGDASMANADDGRSRPKSTETLGIFLRSQHIENNV